MEKTRLAFFLFFMANYGFTSSLSPSSFKSEGNPVRLYDPQKLEILSKKLKNFPNLHLANLPTPLIPLTNLSKHLSGPKIYLKSDNLTGHGGGGNKLRKLSYVLADAVKNGATDIITTGATQSNHSRMTASQCARLGLKCHLILENRRENYDPKHLNSGNIFLDKLFGAQIYHFKKGTDTKKEMELLAQKLKSQNRVPYIIPGGASNPLGAIAYVEAAAEIVEQLSVLNVNARYLVTATGSAGTQAGLAVGLQVLGSEMGLLGISTRTQRFLQEEKVFALTKKIIEKIEFSPSTVNRKFIMVNSDFIGTGYGEPSKECIEAIKLVAEHEGILLDPVYSGKAMAGLIALIRNKQFNKKDAVVFLHTGGEDSLPAYEDYFQF
ncbi:MAG: D-cysteine desulfhydrase family protein [Oligoflexales bacterium]